MKITGRIFLSITLVLAARNTVAAADEVLQVGDPAPKLQTGKFVQGDPVQEFLPGKAYLVEFWATWCAPCRASIPHLNEIHNKFKDRGLIVIGQDCAEKDDSKVSEFIKMMGPRMTYRVALDDKEAAKEGNMTKTWMKAAHRGGIPTLFMVDTHGLIAWIGNPLFLQDEAIEEVLAGKFNAKEAAAAEEKEAGRREAVGNELEAALAAKDWDTAMVKLDELTKLEPASLSDLLNTTRLQILFGKQDSPAASKLIRQMSEAHKDDPMSVNNLAWMIVSDKAIEHPDLDLAEELAQRAADGFKDEASKIEVYDTMARIKFMKGKKEEAVALEQKVIALAGDDRKDRFQKILDSYKKGVLPEPE